METVYEKDLGAIASLRVVMSRCQPGTEHCQAVFAQIRELLLQAEAIAQWKQEQIEATCDEDWKRQLAARRMDLEDEQLGAAFTDLAMFHGD